MKKIISLFICFLIQILNISAEEFDYSITKIFQHQSPFKGNIYPISMLNDENNNQLLVLDYFNSAILFYDLSKNILKEVKQSDDKIKYFYVPKDSDDWEFLNTQKGLFIIRDIFQDFKTKDCFSGLMTVKDLNNGTFGKPTLYSRIKNYEFDVVNDFIKDSLYPRGANIAKNGDKLIFQGIKEDDWSNFLILYDQTSRTEKLILSTNDIKYFLKKDKIENYASGWTYFIDSLNVLYYRYPDILPIIVNINNKSINSLKLSGIAKATQFYKENSNSAINDSSNFLISGFNAKNKSISGLIYHKSKIKNEIDTLCIQTYDSNSLEIQNEVFITCPESNIKKIQYVSGKNENEYYMILVGNNEDIFIYKLVIMNK